MPQLPLAVTVGFSGPRNWFRKEDHPDFDPEEFQKAAENWLAARLQGLPAELGLADRYFLCGISQIAAGGDHAFSLACKHLGIPQRLLLPQPSDVFLDACGSAGPDFTDAEKGVARDLLASSHMIQEKVASGAASRDERFEETNIGLVHLSDVIVAMVKPTGGKWTKDLIVRAGLWKKPALVVAVDLRGGKPWFDARWQGMEPRAENGYTAPALPKVLEGVALESGPLAPHAIPAKDDYFITIKNHCSPEAARLSGYFHQSAWVIVSRHFYASVCAVLALVLLQDRFRKGAFYPTLAVILALEIGFLAQGYARHKSHHEKEAGAHWAMNRLLAEVARSVLAFGHFHTGFTHLWTLDLPDESRALLGTMEILQLRETRLQTCATWQVCRRHYVEGRLVGKYPDPDPEIRKREKQAQINYYREEAEGAGRKYRRAHRIFTIASLSAIAATTIKFVLVVVVCFHRGVHPEVLKSILGFFGVLLPVAAVAALSLAAAKDLEARSHTFREMHRFLLRQAKRLEEAASEREFSHLLCETETRLLGETVTWFSRRTFTGIA